MSAPILIAAGAKFNRLTVVGSSQLSSYGARRFMCRCECGNLVDVIGSRLRCGTVKSCGCMARDAVVRKSQTHGKSESLTYYSWQSMRARCLNSAHPNFPKYGGRGILVCTRWNRFEDFLADMGERPIGTSLDRINNDGNYEPGNCRWATKKQQQNNRRVSKRVVVDGVEMPLSDASALLGIPARTLAYRLAKGVPPSKWRATHAP
jgi:hypothetical protein